MNKKVFTIFKSRLYNLNKSI